MSTTRGVRYMSLYMFDTKFKTVTIWLARDFNAPGINWSNINLFENIDNIYKRSQLSY